MLARTRVALCITTQGITLWLLGTTRTMGAIMVAIDGTFIVTGSILVLICVNADAEVTHLTSPQRACAQCTLIVMTFVIVFL